ncbi:MAG: potassium uptake system, Trk family protein [Chlamydiae bacterium CG10_big_fil_rev_8_21_14_0_10_42_34]|nr:MAG: potassium uptake system, Trk family protein [Chlamydiae bacterium CG10_big_fil_rev_8_21_14_0_10_42_34]
MIFAKIISKYLFYLSALLCVPLGLSTFYQLFPSSHPQPSCTFAFFLTLLISLTLALALRVIGRKAAHQLYRRESILIVVLIWIITSILSALPFSLSGTLKPLDAYFEAMSGLTTTGSTMLCPKAFDPNTGLEVPIRLTNPHVPEKTYIYYGTVDPIRDPDTGLILHSGIEAVSKSLLLWRSLLQWVGGMGIVVIFLTVLPALGVGGKFLYQLESTGPVKDEISPRVRETGSRLWKLYSALTLLEVALLVWTNPQMSFFDALCTSLSTISTGGFSVRNDSIASYNSAATEGIVIAFMILGSINFSLYFHMLKFKFFRIYVPDFFLFLSTAALGCLAVSCFLIPEFGVAKAFREGAFQALSFQTTTGFFSANYDRWPFAPQMFMLILMFIGGMSGSTAGGIKTSRFYIAYKILLHRLELIFRPDSIRKLYIGKNEIDDKNALTVLSFFCIIALFTIIGTFSLVLDGVDPETSIGLIACFLNNVGMAFRAAGPTESMAFLSPFSKILATFWMLLGRLEFFVVLLLFLPSFWKNR